MAHNEARRRLKRLVAMSSNDLDQVLAHLKELHDNFDGVHQTEADAIEGMAEGLLLVQGLLREFWEVCWGPPPSDFNSYR